jgi:hypothetical protein
MSDPSLFTSALSGIGAIYVDHLAGRGCDLIHVVRNALPIATVSRPPRPELSTSEPPLATARGLGNGGVLEAGAERAASPVKRTSFEQRSFVEDE